MVRGPQETTLSIEGVQYKIKKFTPDKACKWAFRLFGNMDLSGAMAGMAPEDAAAELNKKIQQFTSMPEKEFREFQTDCLSCVEAVYAAQNMPVLHIADMSAPTMFQLTIHGFMFSVIDFLDPSFLTNLLGGVSQLMESQPSPPAPASTTSEV